VQTSGSLQILSLLKLVLEGIVKSSSFLNSLQVLDVMKEVGEVVYIYRYIYIYIIGESFREMLNSETSGGLKCFQVSILS
jgi:hypothetical protein